MFSQGEQGQEGLEMDLEMLEAMAQDEMTMQDTPIMQVDYSPQINAESTMGAAAGAAVYDTPPPLLRQNPSLAPSETVTDRGDSASSGSAEISQVGEMLMQMMQSIKEMKDNMASLATKDGMKTNVQQMKNEMKEEMKEMRGEMQRMGLDLQAGQGAQKKELEAIKKSAKRDTKR